MRKYASLCILICMAQIAGSQTTANVGVATATPGGGAQLKYVTQPFAFEAALAGNVLSSEGAISFANAGFTNTPIATVANIVSTGCTSGKLYRMQLILHGCNATSCKARLLNTSPNPINYNVTWNIA